MKVLQLGFGAVGRENVRQLLNKRHHIVAIVDTQDVLDSIDFSEFEFGKAPLPLLNSSLSFCLEETQPDVILQATTFEPQDMIEVIRTAATTRTDVISINGIVNSEVLQPPMHDEINSIAKKAGIRVLGVGAIPGFFSDVIPLTFTGCCSQVQSINFKRRADYSKWGPDVMKRYGFGLSETDFERAAKSGEITLFKSLWQSAYFIARELGWSVTEEYESKHPIISTRNRQGEYVRVLAGTVGGFSHCVTLVFDNERRLVLEVVGYLDPAGPNEAPEMTIDIVGNSTMRVEVSGEVLSGAGSMTSSSARMVNSIEPLTATMPGLRSPADLPLVSCRA